MAAAKKNRSAKKTGGKKPRQVATSVGLNGLVERVLGRAQRDRLLEVAILSIPGLSEQYLQAIFESIELSAPDDVVDDDERCTAWQGFLDDTARLLSTDENSRGEFVRRVSGILDKAASRNRVAFWERLAALWTCERTQDRYAQRNAEEAAGLATRAVARNGVGRRRGSAEHSGPTVSAETQTDNRSVRPVWGASGADARRTTDTNEELRRIDDDEREREAIRKWRDALSKRLPAKTPTTNQALRVAIGELRKAAKAAQSRIEHLEAEQDASIKRTLRPRIEMAKRVAALAGRGSAALEDHAARELIEALKAERDILTTSEMHGRGVGLALAVIAAQRRGARRHPTADAEKAWLLRKAGFMPVEIAERLFPGEAGNMRGRVRQLLHRHRLFLAKQETDKARARRRLGGAARRESRPPAKRG